MGSMERRRVYHGVVWCMRRRSVRTVRASPHLVPTIMMLRRVAIAIAFATLTTTTTGCFLVAAGAGAGAAVAYTNRGASATIEGTVPTVFDRATRAFTSMSITETGRATENSGDLRRLTGTLGDQEVIIEVKRETQTTAKVDVVVKKNVVEYDKDMAKRVLDAVVK